VSENRVLGRIFGPKMEEVIGSWKRLYYKELHDFCASPNIILDDQIQVNEMGGT